MKRRYLWLLLIPVLAAGVFLYLSARDRAERERQQAELAAVTEMTAVLEEGELSRLEQYPNLRYADLSGSRCYDAIDAFADAHPDIRIRYTLPLGDGECSNEVQEVNLREGTYTLPQLLEALPHLRRLEVLNLPETTLDLETLREIAALRPDTLRYTRRFLDQVLTEDTETLDLSGYSMEQLRPGLPVLAMLPALTDLELLNAEGVSPYSLEDALEIHDALPGVRLHDRFSLFGKIVDTEDERLEYLDTFIGDEGLVQIRQALSLMPDCSYLKLDDCGTTNETMAAMRDEYEGRVKVVWRVHYGIFSDLTDTKVVHAVADEHGTTINDEMCRVLCYCVDTEYMDLGHNPLQSIEFCRSMPHLKAAILSYNNITDLSPLSGCQELYFLELFCCRKLEDLSPLESCKNLRMLNISFSTVTDISPVYGLDRLELFHAARTDVPREQIEELAQRVPDCRITYEGRDIHEVGWRKIREGQYYDWYLELREIFGYKDPNSWSHK